MLLAMILVFSLPISASATNGTPPTSAATNEGVVTPRGFVREYEQFYTIGVTLAVMEDYNADFWQDDTVTVSFIETSGPTEFWVSIFYGEDGSSGFMTLGKQSTLSLNDSTTLTIPKGYTFAVSAKATDGESGYARFQVSLS